MEREVVDRMIYLYSELKNLKLVGQEMDIPWQTVYWWLKKEGITVTGDKKRYGGIKDQIGLIGEHLFKQDCPFAEDENLNMFQAKYDYTFKGLKLDVKTSFIREAKGRVEGRTYPRWAFNCRVQQEADFIICYCLSGDVNEYSIENVLLLPNEIVKDMQTISVTVGKSKWFDYDISRLDLKRFFESF